MPPKVPPSPLTIARVTWVLLSVVTVLPEASWMAITGCVARTDPEIPPTGCVVIANCVAVAAGVIVCVTGVKLRSFSQSPSKVNM